jgi:glyoxalase superfamily protein
MEGIVKFQVVFDAAEPEKLGGFWKLALGYVDDSYPPQFASLEEFFRAIGIPEEEWGDQWALVDPAGEGPRLYFQRVPEGKTAKNRVHLDVRVAEPSADREERAALIAAHVARLEAAGGSVLRRTSDVRGTYTVMQDPEGNEFCVT